MAKATTNKLFDAIEEAQWDMLMACSAVGLALFGLVMVYSASGAITTDKFGGSFHFVMRQIAWAVAGIVAMLILMRIDYQRYASPTLILLLLGVSIVLLFAVFFFPARNGAKRWITLGGFSAQPSELAKLAFIAFMAYFLTRRNEDDEQGSFQATFLPAAVVAGILMALIVKEPDLGTALMIGILFAVMMWIGRVPTWHLLLLVLPAIPIGWYLLWHVGFRQKRLLAFLNPESDPQGAGYQILQSLYAVGSGGLSGVGLGSGKQKLGYLPEARTDFIFAVIGEELGFVGSVLVVIVFGLLMWRCLKASFRAPDQFGQLLGIGLTTMLIAQAFFNMSVVLSLVPTKGIPLPFVSAGGSSLLFALAAVGILLNISEQARQS
ncbi:MAG TPA: putative lipid II flippase FtsW [Blastocatellia bacterium]|nr:putative lipid II flippase FtsW [Blastocatellia bacterium]